MESNHIYGGIMKIKVTAIKEIKDMSIDELKSTFNENAKNAYYSTGYGLDWFNANETVKLIKKELRKRKIKLGNFIDEMVAEGYC